MATRAVVDIETLKLQVQDLMEKAAAVGTAKIDLEQTQVAAAEQEDFLETELETTKQMNLGAIQQKQEAVDTAITDKQAAWDIFQQNLADSVGAV